MVLLNSEGPILTALRAEANEYVVYDTDDSIVAVLTLDEIQEFVHGTMILVDSFGKEWRYAEQPGSMKPDLRELDMFIGIDTTDKVY